MGLHASNSVISADVPRSRSGLLISNWTTSLWPLHHASKQNKVSHKLILAGWHVSNWLDLVTLKVFSNPDDSVTL